DGSTVGALRPSLARGTISGTRRLGGRAPHRLRGARLGAHRSHSVARRARAPAARGRHRRAESDRRARPGTRHGPARLSRPLGRPLEDHLLLSPAGDLLRVLEPAAAEGLARPIAPDIRAGVAAAVAAGSGAPLAPAIEDVARAIALEWGAVTRDLILVERDRIRVSESFRRALAETLAAAGGRGPRATAALTAVVELAGLLEIGRAHV